MDPERTLEQAKREATFQLLFRVARRVNERALERVRRATGVDRLRPAHTALFPHIDLEGTRPSVLAERLGVSRQAVGALVAELEAMGVVDRVPDPDDGRGVRVVFRDGARGLHEGLGLLRDLEAEAVEALGPGPVADLREGLLAFEEALDGGLLT